MTRVRERLIKEQKRKTNPEKKYLMFIHNLFTPAVHFHQILHFGCICHICKWEIVVLSVKVCAKKYVHPMPQL